MRLLSVLPLLLPALDLVSAGTRNLVADTASSYSLVTKHNDVLSPLLRDLCSSTDYFKYYKLNLFTRECPYFSEDGAFCGNRACAVDTIEEEDVPEIWRASVLGRLTGPSATAASNLPLHTVESKSGASSDGLMESTGETCVQEGLPQGNRDFCVAEDEGSECVYVSLLDNEERYTGYGGSHARAIWGAIYRENCFESHTTKESAQSTSISKDEDISDNSPPVKMSGIDSSVEEFAQILRDPLKSEHGNQDTCVEKRIFYRIISGMHASISTHICASHLNQLSGRWEPNATCFDERLRQYPERISNIYFNYVLVSRAVAKLGDYLNSYTFCSGDPVHDRMTASKVQEVTTLAQEIKYDETSLFEDRLLKEDFRNRFMNISMLMDCVGCDKCRLWGKVQTSGYGTALKVLFEDTTTLSRGELVALFNTYGRLSISLDALKTFNYSMPGMDEDEDDIEHIIDVSDDSSVADEEVVLSPPLENPQVDHAVPKAPFEQISSTLSTLWQMTRSVLRHLPNGSSFWQSVRMELAEFEFAIHYIFSSYYHFPKRVWYQLFVARRESSFWDFVFQARRDSQEL